jgi:hypothetical protein
MKIVAAGNTYSDFENTLKYLFEIKEGIILFSEGSFDPAEGLNWTLNDLAKHTKDLPMTLVGEKENQIRIVKNGLSFRAQLNSLMEEEFWCKRTDILYDVSYKSEKKILAFSRICADGITPYSGKDLADLLLISSGGMDWKEDINSLLKSHKDSLEPNSLIVQSDIHMGNEFIYSMEKERFVGKEKVNFLGDKYLVYDF